MKDLNLLNRVYPNKSDQTKRIILKHAVCCFYEKGLESTTIEMIRIRSNLSIGTIYYHFKTKEGIIAHLVFAAIDDLFNWRQRYLLDARSFQECVYAFVLSYADWVDSHPNFAQILLSGKFDVHTGEYTDQLKKRKLDNRKIVHDWLSMPEYKYDIENIPQDLISSLINGITEHYSKYWLLDRVKLSPKHYRKELAHATWIVIKEYETL